MPRKKLRKIWYWRNEGRSKRAGRLKPAAPLAFRARRNRRESKHTVIAEAVAQLPQSRRGGQWHGQVKIADDFDTMPESFMECFGR